MWSALLLVAALVQPIVAQATGNHPEWDRWCGKAYQPKYPSFDPGGQLEEPPALPDGPALYVQFAPRYSIYLESENQGEFVISTIVSKWHGSPWPGLDSPQSAPDVKFTIGLNNKTLLSDSIAVGTTSKVFPFDISGIKPRFEPYNVTFSSTSATNGQPILASTELFYLPEKDEGSVSRLDNLHGGFLVRNSKTNGKFEPFLPYGFYASCDGFLCEDDAQDAVRKYSDLGLNSMVPLTPIFDSRPVFELFDELDLKFMYDLRGYFQNLTAVREQVSAIKNFDALYSYWGSDEPDGWQYPFNATILSRDVIRSIDPYHPISVTLNCQNYYFDEYTRGADFIMEDAYPIGINSTFSKWGTPCNTTYGDCGCDNCDQSGVLNVPQRLDDLDQYEEWLGLWPKTKAHNPQSFSGEGYWLRDPTVKEEVAMNALAFNHGAQAIVSWVWPTSDILADIHGQFAKKVAVSPVRDFIVSGEAKMVDVPEVDVAYWVSGSELLLSVVNGVEEVKNGIEIKLPSNVVPKSVKSQVWGGADWKLSSEGVSLDKAGKMATYMAIFKIDESEN